MVLLLSFIFFATIGLLLYKYLTRNFDYWKIRNVPYAKPLPLFGNYFDIMSMQITVGHYFAKLYKQFNAPYFGIFILNKPALVVKSPELIKLIFIRDFNYFCDRMVLSDKDCDSIFSRLLFVIKNPEWKIIRSKMGHAFTGSKLRGMLPIITDTCEHMLDYIRRYSNNPYIDAKELCLQYTTDVIATCAFGVKSNCFEDENAEFRIIGRKMFDFTWETAIRQVSCVVIPNFAKFFRLRFFKRGVNEFLRDTFWSTLKLRENTNTSKGDLVDIMIQMTKEADDTIDFTGDMVVAQAVMFFAAGFETTSVTMSFTMYELCLAPTIQEKARTEIKEVYAKHGHLSVEVLSEMKYLHMIMLETLRKYPVLPFLDRVCVKDYKLPGEDLVIEKGTAVHVSTFGVNYDPDIYSDPERYDPERFSEENRNSIPNYAFLPFGEGPRNCIGERFAIVAFKLGLARILLEYELERCAKTPVPVEFEIKSFVLASKVGMPIKFRRIVD